jgi:oxygen-independent coproporphyrinogen-3 oxidase
MLDNNKLPVIEYNLLNLKDKMAETMIMNLRLKSGVNKLFFKNKFGCFPEDVYEKKINKLIEKKLIKVDSKSITLQKDKFLLANIAMVEFV